MIICQHCQVQTDDGSVFCENCGHELTPASAPPGPPAQQRSFHTPPPVSSDALLHTPVAPRPYAPLGDQRNGGQSAGRMAVPEQRFASPVALPIITLRLPNGQRFMLGGKYEYTVGRASPDQSGQDVDLSEFYGQDAGVSRSHLKIRVGADGVFVQDLVSKNETVQNGYRLMPQQWYPLRDGDELRLGAIILSVSIEQPRP
jgi:pSer/pThr/pTyr-binding forkhead associated (FHA) protein